MAIFDALIDDMAQRFGLGANAGPLVREALTLITGSQGGIGGFLNLFKTAGLSSEVASWLGHSNAAPLAAPQIDKVLGAKRARGHREPPRPRAGRRLDGARLCGCRSSSASSRRTAPSRPACLPR